MQNSGVGTKFSEVSNKGDSVIRVYSKDYGNTGWIGQHAPFIGYGNIKINEFYHDSYGGFDTYSEVFSYEMGHAFGLSHYECYYRYCNN